MTSIRTAGLTKDFGDLRAVNEIDLPVRAIPHRRQRCPHGQPDRSNGRQVRLAGVAGGPPRCPCPTGRRGSLADRVPRHQGSHPRPCERRAASSGRRMSRD